MKINIQEIIKDNNITTHDELQRHLSKLSDSKYYWDYDYNMFDMLKSSGIMIHCVEIELEDEKRFYEIEQF